jgi:tetrahydromethanopterin S-methyltransferase subunit A
MTTDYTATQAPPWPVISGRYVVGNPDRSVAVCTLASSDLVDAFEGVQDIAIAGRLYTLNLGLEKLVWNIVSNPHIRFLLLCGEDTAMSPSRGIIQLHERGLDDEHRIVGIESGYPTSDQCPRIFERQQ